MLSQRHREIHEGYSDKYHTLSGRRCEYDALSVCWEYHTLSAAHWEYDALGVRACFAADLQGTLVRGHRWLSPSSRVLLTSSTPMAYLSLLSRMSPSLLYSLLSSSLPSARGSSLPSRSPNDLARLRGLSHLPSVTPACFWLVVAWQNFKPRPSKAFVVFYFCNFLSFNSLFQNKVKKGQVTFFLGPARSVQKCVENNNLTYEIW